MRGVVRPCWWKSGALRLQGGVPISRALSWSHFTLQRQDESIAGRSPMIGKPCSWLSPPENVQIGVISPQMFRIARDRCLVH